MLVRDGADLSTAELVRLLRCSLGKTKKNDSCSARYIALHTFAIGKKSDVGAVAGLPRHR